MSFSNNIFNDASQQLVSNKDKCNASTKNLISISNRNLDQDVPQKKRYTE